MKKKIESFVHFSYVGQDQKLTPLQFEELYVMNFDLESNMQE